MTQTKDSNLWLEDVEGRRVLSWVYSQNQRTRKELGSLGHYKKNLAKIGKLLESKDKVPNFTVHGNYLYSVFQDSKAIRGKWVRTKIGGKLKPLKDWETVLDLDLLSKKEGINWVLNEVKCLEPEGRYCLMIMSNGGTDRAVVKEFDTILKKFRKNGFLVPEGKSWVDWVDSNTIAVSTNFGKGTLTTSGYGKFLKTVQRKQSFSEAPLIVEVPDEYLTVITQAYQNGYKIINVGNRYYSQVKSTHVIVSENKSTELNIPEATIVEGFLKNHVVLSLRKKWDTGGKSFNSGDLVIAKLSDLLDKSLIGKVRVRVLYRPPRNTSIQRVAVTKDFVSVNILENVVGKILRITVNGKAVDISNKRNGRMLHSSIVGSSYKKNLIFIQTENFISPSKLSTVNLRNLKNYQIFSSQPKFNSSKMVIRQKWTKSKDGTEVPYFLIGKKDSIQSKSAPVLVRGYGGFEYSQLPKYDPVLGSAWLEKGALYVLANIRGGGEFGPQWHLQAIKENRQRAYDDFIAVAEDLLKKNITKPGKIGIYGGSNGGLLMGAAMTQRPDLYGAVISIVPLLDMLRYHKLLAGAAWIGEYGDPDKPEERKYIQKYSPYQNLRKEKKYPPTFLFTSTKDDRVHPGHARKFAYRLMNYGNKDTYYFENTEGGHKGSSTVKNESEWQALSFQFLWKYLGN